MAILYVDSMDSSSNTDAPMYIPKIMQQDQLRYDRRRYARGPGLPRPFLTVEDEDWVPKSHSYVVSRVLSRHDRHTSKY